MGDVEEEQGSKVVKRYIGNITRVEPERGCGQPLEHKLGNMCLCLCIDNYCTVVL